MRLIRRIAWMKRLSWRGGARGGGVLAVSTSIFGELLARDAPCDIVVS